MIRVGKDGRWQRHALARTEREQEAHANPHARARAHIKPHRHTRGHTNTHKHAPVADLNVEQRVEKSTPPTLTVMTESGAAATKIEDITAAVPDAAAAAAASALEPSGAFHPAWFSAFPVRGG